MHVQSILENKGYEVVTTRPDESIADVCKILTARRIGALVVLDEADNVVGVISERDVVHGIARHGGRVTELTVADLMTRDVLLCTPTDTIDTIMKGMTERRIRHLPVVEEARLIGLVSIGDVVKQRLDLQEMEVSSLRQYVMETR